MEIVNINDFLGIAIVGAGLSLAIEYINAKYDLNSPQAKGLAIALSIVVGGVYWFLQGTDIWQAILGILAAASAVYALFFSGKVKDEA